MGSMANVDTPIKVHKRKNGCTDVVFLLVFIASLFALGWLFDYGLTRGDLDKILYGQDYMSDLCGRDNSEAATGLPLVVNATYGGATFWSYLWPFELQPQQYEVPTLRGARNHSQRRFLYYTFPAEELDGWRSTAVCLERCPAVPVLGNGSAEDPASWVCTGKYSDGPPAECPGGWGDAEACVAYRNALFTRAGPAVLERCNEPLSDCDVCYPPYETIGMVHYCLPDPKHALETFQSVAVALIATGAAVGKTLGERDPVAVRGANGTLHWEPRRGMTVGDLEQLREFVSSAPHLAYEDVRVAAPVICGCLVFAFCFGLVWMVLLRFWASLMVWATLGAIGAGFGGASWWLFDRLEWMRRDVRYASDDLFRHQADSLHVWAYVVAVVGALYLLAVLCCRSKIAIAVRVMKEATRAVSALPLLLLTPLLTLACVLGVTCFGVFSGLLLVSTGELRLGRAGFGHLDVPPEAVALVSAHAFLCLWLTWWFKHLQHATVAGGISTWYFAADKWRDVGSFPVAGAYCRAVTRTTATAIPNKPHHHHHHHHHPNTHTRARARRAHTHTRTCTRAYTHIHTTKPGAQHCKCAMATSRRKRSDARTLRRAPMSAAGAGGMRCRPPP